MTLGGTRLFATALALGLTASRLTHSCAYPCLACALFLRRVAALGSRGGVSPHQGEVERGGLPTPTRSSKPARSRSPGGSGPALQQRRCGRAAPFSPRSGAHKR